MEKKQSNESKETKGTNGTEENTQSRIELRSEKVRNIIGEIPPALVRWGIAIIVIIFAVLLAIVLCVKFPYGNGETILQHILL